MKTFKINKKTPIMLYGISIHRKNLASNMRLAGFNVIGCFDKNAKNFSSMTNIPVYTIDNAPFLKKQKEKICVIICMQNALHHDYVAEELSIAGYTRILFLPMNSNIKKEAAALLREKYNQFFRNLDTDLNKIPFYGELFFVKFDIERAIQIKNSEYMVVWVPVEMVFSVQDHTPYGNCNIMNYVYKELFLYLESKNGELKKYFEYIHSWENNQESSEKIDYQYLLHRAKLYNVFLNELNQGMDFFIYSAALAQWDESSKFYLIDGNHRSAFLCNKGLKKIPVNIRENEWDRWVNRKELNGCISFMQRVGMYRLPAPIAHPAFIFLEEESNGYVYYIMKHILSFSFDITIRNKKILDFSQYHYFFSHLFSRMGAKEVITVEKDEVLYPFTQMINQLLYFRNIHVYKDVRLIASQEVDIAFLLGTCTNLLGTYEKEDAECFVENINEAIFWVSSKNAKTEKAWIKERGFKFYKEITKHIKGDFMQEIGFFTKNRLGDEK